MTAQCQLYELSSSLHFNHHLEASIDDQLLGVELDLDHISKAVNLAEEKAAALHADVERERRQR